MNRTLLDRITDPSFDFTPSALCSAEGDAAPAGGAPAPAASPAPAAPAAPAAPVYPPGEEWRAMSAEQFTGRLGSATASGAKAAYEALGFKSKAEAEAAVKEYQALRDAQKAVAEKDMTELQKARARLAELEGVAAGKTKADEALKRYADHEFAVLPKEAQDFIAATAGDDPLARLNAINHARSTGLLAKLAGPAAPVAPVVAPVVPVVPPVPPKPATTIGPGGPTPPAPSGALSHLQIWKALKESGKGSVASSYRVQNRVAIEAEEAANK